MSQVGNRPTSVDVNASTGLQAPSYCVSLVNFYLLAIFAFRMTSCEDSNVICSHKTYLSIFLNNEHLFFDIFHGVLLALSEMYEQYPSSSMLHGGDLNVDACEHRMRQT